jgi:hypothetical protein
MSRTGRIRGFDGWRPALERREDRVVASCDESGSIATSSIGDWHQSVSVCAIGRRAK